MQEPRRNWDQFSLDELADLHEANEFEPLRSDITERLIRQAAQAHVWERRARATRTLFEEGRLQQDGTDTVAAFRQAWAEQKAWAEQIGLAWGRLARMTSEVLPVTQATWAVNYDGDLLGPFGTRWDANAYLKDLKRIEVEAASHERPHFLVDVAEADHTALVREQAKTSRLEADIEAAWKACGVTPEDLDANDDPDCETLAQTIGILLDHERGALQDLKDRYRSLQAAFVNETVKVNQLRHFAHDVVEAVSQQDDIDVVADGRRVLAATQAGPLPDDVFAQLCCNEDCRSILASVPCLACQSRQYKKERDAMEARATKAEADLEGYRSGRTYCYDPAWTDPSPVGMLQSWCDNLVDAMDLRSKWKSEKYINLSEEVRSCREERDRLRTVVADNEAVIRAADMRARLAEMDRIVDDIGKATSRFRGEIAALNNWDSRCRGCGRPLVPENSRIADGCPCNTERGVNHGLVDASTCTCDECDPEQTGSVR